MKLSIGYATGRAEPELRWLVGSLARQVHDGDEIEIIVIDLRGRSTEELGIGLVPAAISVYAYAPKPNLWQGEHRVTKEQWWAKASALNTFLCLAQHDYVAAVDDRCTLGAGWLETVRRGHRERRSVLCGSYDRVEGVRTVPDGRRDIAPAGKINCGGAWLYGCTWALPLAWALAVNGFEEGTDGLGAEDYIFGLNLANAGHRLDFVPNMRVALERSAHASTGINGHAVSPVPTIATPSPKRTDKGVSPRDKSHAALSRFGTRKRTEMTPDLMLLRRQLAAGGTFPVPDPAVDHRDWYDGQLIREM